MQLYDAAKGELIPELAHIHGQSPEGPRYNPELSEAELHGYNNLLALCPNHHEVVDKYADKYPADELREWKRKREAELGDSAKDVFSSKELLHRLVDALAPRLPDEWWERPGAPQLILGLASSRRQDQPWVFEATIEQVGGGDTGPMRARFRGDMAQQDLELYPATRIRKEVAPHTGDATT